MEESSPFKDLPNFPPTGSSGSTSTAHDSTKATTGKRPWYSQLPDLKKVEYLNNLEKMRISRQQKKYATPSPNMDKLGASRPLVSPLDFCAIKSKQSVVTQMAGTPRVVATPVMEPSMTTDDDSDWLHRDNSYQRLTTQNLDAPKKHHVLRKVSDCRHCDALRFPFEGHFSFTSLGVTLDRRVSTAARTGVYTFRACGALYHALDDLLSGDHGPRHLQLIFLIVVKEAWLWLWPAGLSSIRRPTRSTSALTP